MSYANVSLSTSSAVIVPMSSISMSIANILIFPPVVVPVIAWISMSIVSEVPPTITGAYAAGVGA